MKALVVYANETEFNKNANFSKLKFLLESLGFTVVNAWLSVSPSDDEYISNDEIKEYDLIIQKGVDLELKCNARVIHIDNGNPKALDSDPTIFGELTHAQHEVITKVTNRIALREQFETWRMVIFATFASIAGCIWLATAIAKYFYK